MPSIRTQTLITVADVEASSRWYQQLLGVGSGHGGPDYERLVAPGDDSFLMQLHDWEADEHEHLGDREVPDRGNGVVLWFMVDDIDGAFGRVAELGAEVLIGPLVNPNARHREIWVRDPDGYTVVLAGPPGDIGDADLG